jgi:outer membrane lipoprotein SlyB
MMNTQRKMLPVLAMLAASIAACTTLPTGPSRMALPGAGKSFDQFRADDAACRQYALENSGATPQQIQEASGVKSAVVGTAIGAAAGAALGGSGRSAAAGAGAGLLMGSVAGTAAGEQSGYMMQRRYDDGYTQCMYAKGHRVAVPGGMVYTPQQPAAQPYFAPPPPGSAPPPPHSIVR